MMRRALVSLLALPLLAQAPTKGTKAFFLQDPKVVIAACAEEAQTLEKDKDDAERNAEFGRAFLAAGLRDRADDLFARAGVASQRGMIMQPLAMMISNAGKVGVPAFVNSSDLSVPTGSILQLVGCGWLRAGHVPEALAMFESMRRLGSRDEDGYFKAAQDLLRAGLPQEAEELALSGWDLKPTEWEAALDFAQVAAMVGQKHLAEVWCQKAVNIAPKEALAWSRGARVLANAEGWKAGPGIPWAAPMAAHTQGAARTVWVVGGFKPQLTDERGFFSSAEQSFTKAFPDRVKFSGDLMTRLSGVIEGAKPLAGTTSTSELHAQRERLAGMLGPRDLILGVDLFEVKDDKVSRSTSTMHFRSARLRMAIFNMDGTLIATHTVQVTLPRITNLEKGVDALMAQALDFLAGPTFARWRE